MSAKILSASALVAVAGLVLATSVVAQSDNQIAFVHVASAQQRLRYLATAKIWSDPGDVTPEMMLAGRPLKAVGGVRGARFAASRCHAISPNQGKRSAATRRNSRA